MSNDDLDVDRILKNAGAAWRAEQPADPQPDLSRATSGGRRTARRWVPALAAAAVAAIAVGVITVAQHDGAGPAPNVPVASGGGSAEPTTAAGSTLVVHDGDTVEATGKVIAAPGKPAVFCPNLASPAVGYPPGKEPAPSCDAQFAVPLTGVDLTKLSDRRTVKGVVEGGVTLRGIWRDRSIAVQQTGPMRLHEREPWFGVPCAAPEGGWKTGAWGDASEHSQQLNQYVDAHPDLFGFLRMGYPDGTPSDPNLSEKPMTEVIVVGVYSGDLERVRAQLEQLYSGNLCVAKSEFSLAQLRDAQNSLNPLLKNKRGLYGFGLGAEKVEVDLLVVDDALYAELAKVGLEKLELKPAVRPVA